MLISYFRGRAAVHSILSKTSHDVVAPSSSRGGLGLVAGVALFRGSLGDFKLCAQLLLIHQHLCRQTPAAQARLEDKGKVV